MFNSNKKLLYLNHLKKNVEQRDTYNHYGDNAWRPQLENVQNIYINIECEYIFKIPVVYFPDFGRIYILYKIYLIFNHIYLLSFNTSMYNTLAIIVNHSKLVSTQSQIKCPPISPTPHFLCSVSVVLANHAAHPNSLSRFCITRHCAAAIFS